MLPIYIALTSRTDRVGLADLAPVAAALQKQVVRDFAPIWGVTASVGFFPSENIPMGYWAVSVEDEVHQGGGVHLTWNNQPYALVKYGPSWQLAASHEVLEMLADPWGSRTVPGPALNGGAERVEYLVEVCDPCEDSRFAYTVDGVPVSDFYTPRYFDPVASPTVRYSFQGRILAPRQVLPNGYLCWFDGARRLFRAFADENGQLSIDELPALDAQARLSLREHVDQLTPRRQTLLSDAVLPQHLLDAGAAAKAGCRSFAAYVGSSDTYRGLP